MQPPSKAIYAQNSKDESLAISVCRHAWNFPRFIMYNNEEKRAGRLEGMRTSCHNITILNKWLLFMLRGWDPKHSLRAHCVEGFVAPDSF